MARTRQYIAGLLATFGLAFASGVTLVPATAIADEAPSETGLAHATPDKVTVQKADVAGAVLRVINDTAGDLTYGKPAVIVTGIEAGSVFTITEPKVLDATTFPATELHDPTRIPVGGYLELRITSRVDVGKSADATMQIPVRAAPGGADSLGQVIAVPMHTGPPGEPVVSLKPEVTKMTVTSTRHWFRWPFTAKGGLGIQSPLAGHDTLAGTDLPVAMTAACPATAALPSAHLASEKADTTGINTKCRTRTGGSGQGTLDLAFSDLDMNGATYKGTLRLGEDEKSDVAITLHRRLGGEIAFLAIVLGILCGLFFQRQRVVTGPVRRLEAQLELVPESWKVADLDFDLTDDVDAQRGALKNALFALKRERPMSLSKDDPVLADIVADIRSLLQLQETWVCFQINARSLKGLLIDYPESLPGKDRPGRPVVMQEADELLTPAPEARPPRPQATIATLPELAKRITEQKELVDAWCGTADAICETYDRVQELPSPTTPPAVSDGNGETPATRESVLDELQDTYAALWSARTQEDLKEARDNFIKQRKLAADLPDVVMDSMEHVVIDSTSPILGVRSFDYSDLSEGLSELLGSPTERLDLIDPAIIAQRKHTFLTTPTTPLRDFAGPFSWLLVILIFAAVAWTGFKLSWIDTNDFGSWGDLAAAFAWGLVTPAVLDLLVTAIDGLRVGAVPYVGRIKSGTS